MSTPVVVQGTPVMVPPQQSAHVYTSSLETSGPPAAGTFEGKRQTSCNDPIFVVLFYAALVAIVAVAALYGPAALESATADDTNDTSATNEYEGYVILTVICVCISFFGAGAGMALLFCIPQFLIKTALIFTVVLSGLWAVFSFISGSIWGGVIGLIFFALMCCYARAVWHRIPFATANLVTACTAIRANLGVAIYAYMFAILAGAWSIVWSLAFVGIYDKTSDCTDVNNARVCSSPSYAIMFFLFLALFFVQQVIQVGGLFEWSDMLGFIGFCKMHGLTVSSSRTNVSCSLPCFVSCIFLQTTHTN